MIIKFISVRRGRRGFSMTLARPGSDPPHQCGDCPPSGRFQRPTAKAPINWLWENRFAFGKISLVCGDPGVCKSFLLSGDFAARISRGGVWPDGAACRCGSVLLLSAEDDAADTLRPRLEAHGADLSRIHILDCVRCIDDEGRTGERGFTLNDVPRLEAALRQNPDIRAMIIDPVSAYLADSDSHNNAEIRGLLAPLARLAAEYGVAIILVTHLSKSGGAKAMYRAMGSLAFVAAARSAWLVARDNENEQRRLLLPIKNNIGDDRTGFAFSIINGAVSWEPEPIVQRADELLGEESGQRGPKPEEREAAEQWLKDLLAMGPKPAKEVREEGEAAGYYWGTIRRAKDALTVKVYRDGFGEYSQWWWSLADSGDHPSEGAQHEGAHIPSHSGNLRTFGAFV
jgi:putative DNA primase/helicase